MATPISGIQQQIGMEMEAQLMKAGNNGKYVARMWLHLLLLLLLSVTATSTRTVVETLPGFSDTLPFKLETG
jgi:hypothetical protein